MVGLFPYRTLLYSARRDFNGLADMFVAGMQAGLYSYVASAVTGV